MKVFVTLLLLVVFCVGLHAQESHPLKEAFLAQSEEMKKLSAEKIPIAEKVVRFKGKMSLVLLHDPVLFLFFE